MSEPQPKICGVSVSVRGLCKRFGNQQVLKGIDFEVAAGELFVVMGPSGSGKSVLLKAIIGLESPDKGEVLINGEPINSGSVLDRFRLAMVFQSGALLNSLTVGENVGLYLTEHKLASAEEVRRIVEEKLAIVGLKGVESKYPNELSGGMKKRVAIARALVVDPQLVLYDEPTSELDPMMAKVVTEEIAYLNDSIHATSIVVSHDRDLAFGIADRIAIIDDGRIILVGTPDEIKASQEPRIRDFLNPVLTRKRL